MKKKKTEPFKCWALLSRKYGYMGNEDDVPFIYMTRQEAKEAGWNKTYRVVRVAVVRL